MSMWSSWSCWLASNNICFVTWTPFLCFFFVSPRRETNSSKSWSILYSIFSRYFNFAIIRYSSLREEVAAVCGRWAIAFALPFIMSFKISFCSFDTGSCDPTAPFLPVAPQDVMGRAFGFASNECNYISLLFYWSFASFDGLSYGLFDFSGTGVSTSLKVSSD